MRIAAPAARLAAACLFAAPAAAATTQDERLWVNATVIGSISGRLMGFAEVQPRTGDGLSRLDQLLLRPAIGWRVGKTLTLWQGYAHVINPVAGRRDVAEDRSFQQISWTPIARHADEVQTRTRLEQRWRNDGSDTGWRVRQMVRYEHALNGPLGGVAAMASAEVFVALNDTDWGARGGFDQARLFAGLEVPLGGRSTAEIGYLNQAIDQTRGRTQINHVASITLFWRP